MSFPRNNLSPIAACFLAAFSLLGWLRGADAFEEFGLTIKKLEDPAWRAEGLSLFLSWPSLEGVAYRLEVERFEWLEPQRIITGIKLDCARGTLSDKQISCRRGRLHLPWKGLDDPKIDVNFTFDQTTGGLKGGLKNLATAGGKAQVDFSLKDRQWRGSLHGKGLNLQPLLALLPVDPSALQGWSYAGKLGLEANLSGDKDGLSSADWRADLTELAFSDAEGINAGEGLEGEIKGRLKRISAGWDLKTEVSLQKGELLTPRFYLNPATHPLQLTASLSSDEAFKRLHLQASRLVIQELLTANAMAELELGEAVSVHSLYLDTEPLQVGRLYREMLQPVLFGTALGNFELEGTTDLSLRLDGERIDLDLALEDVHFDDADSGSTARRLGLYDLSGSLHWNQGGEPKASWLAWQSGHLLEQIDLGASRIDFQVKDRTFKLLRQASLPVIDGNLVVDRLDVQGLAGPEQNIQFDGILEPISMSALSQALGWPPLSGKLSGMLPGLTYQNGQFVIDGVLLVRIFDGDILIRNLRLQDLFGVFPQLQADIELKSLDLETLTSTFSFGKITGRLDGYMRGLRLEAWQPVAFDARFHTPEDDKSRRRISQQAVDNISDIGGAGLSGSLARTFLGMFEEFRYKRLGIGCRLRDGTCEMTGVGKAKQGYYLVEGSGIPRIDIIGFNHTADWSRLVEQLKQITESGAPVIE